MPASSILLLETDLAAGDSIEGILSGAGYVITRTDNADEAIRLAPEHQIVLLDVVSGMRSSVDVCAEIRATPALSAVPVMCISGSEDVEERIRFLEAGADDVQSDEGGHRIWTSVENLHEVSKALEPLLGEGEGAKLAWRPSTEVEVRGEDAQQLLKLLDALEEDDDVQTVWGNEKVPDEELANFA